MNCLNSPMANPINIRGPSNPIGRDAAPANITLIALHNPVMMSVTVGIMIPIIDIRYQKLIDSNKNSDEKPGKETE